jgi:hypothetical protein
MFHFAMSFGRAGAVLITSQLFCVRAALELRFTEGAQRPLEYWPYLCHASLP